MKKSVIIEIISYLLFIVFLYAGASKLLDLTLFRAVIAQSPVLKPFALWLAWIIPPIEVVISVILLVPAWRTKGLYAALGSMILFTGYIIAIFSLDKRLPCACGGIIENLSWKGHLV